MLGTPIPLIRPLPVEIATHNDWWQAWLPFAGSIVVASVAFAGVWLSNRTNRQSITAADEREFVRWRREKFLELADEILNNSELATGRLRGCTSWRIEDGADRHINEINNLISAILISGKRMSFVTDDLDSEIKALFDSVSELFIFVGVNWKQARNELGAPPGPHPTISSINVQVKQVGAMQREFILAVRRTSAALGDLRGQELSRARPDEDGRHSFLIDPPL